MWTAKICFSCVFLRVVCRLRQQACAPGIRGPTRNQNWESSTRAVRKVRSHIFCPFFGQYWNTLPRGEWLGGLYGRTVKIWRLYMFPKPSRVKSCECRKATPHFCLPVVRLGTRSLMQKWGEFHGALYYAKKWTPGTFIVWPALWPIITTFRYSGIAEGLLGLVARNLQKDRLSCFFFIHPIFSPKVFHLGKI